MANFTSTTISGIIDEVTLASGSIYFPGSSGLTVAGGSNFILTGDFTIECWFYGLSGTSGAGGLFEFGTYIDGVFIRPYSGDDYYVNLISGGINLNATYFPINKWHHIAVVRSGTAVKLYANGISIKTLTISGNVNSAGGTLKIGTGTGISYNGYISNFRVVNGTAVYTSNFIPYQSQLPPTSNISFLLAVQPNDPFKDASTNNFAITRVGTPTFNNVGPFNPAPLSTGTSQNVPMRQFRDGTIMISGFYDEVGESGPSFVPGLAGKFFNGDWRSTISTGNIGTIPLTTANDSSNVTGTTGLPSSAHRYGVNLWPSIAYGNGLGDTYGFIAIGYFTPPTTGTYTIYTSSDDGSGVWIGALALEGATRTTVNATLNNGMGSGQGDTKRSATIALTGGVTYPIRIVMEEGNGGDNLTFSWSGPGITETTDLLTYFKTPANPDGSLTGNY